MGNALRELIVFQNRLSKAIDNSLINEVQETVITAMHENIETEVYGKYNPTRYSRKRSNGGLLDRKNISTNLYYGLHELMIKNVRKSNLSDRKSIVNVTEIIESGNGYNWKNSNIYHMQPFPRPFHEKTENDIIKDGRANKALINGLIRNGFKAH